MAKVALIPQVFNVDVTIGYYRDILGFELDWATDHYDSGRNPFSRSRETARRKPRRAASGKLGKH